MSGFVRSGSLFLKFSDSWVERTCTLNFITGDFTLSEKNGELNVKSGKFFGLNEADTGKPFSFQIDTVNSKVSLILAADSDASFTKWKNDFSKCLTVFVQPVLDDPKATTLLENDSVLEAKIEESSPELSADATDLVESLMEKLKEIGKSSSLSPTNIPAVDSNPGTLTKPTATSLASDKLDLLFAKSIKMPNAYIAPEISDSSSFPTIVAAEAVSKPAEVEFSFADCYGSAEEPEPAAPAPMTYMTAPAKRASPAPILYTTAPAKSKPILAATDDKDATGSCPHFQLKFSDMILNSSKQLLRRIKVSELLHKSPAAVGFDETKRRLAEYVFSEDLILKNLSAMKAQNWLGVLKNLKTLEENEVLSKGSSPVFNFSVVDASNSDQSMGSVSISLLDGIDEVCKQLSVIFVDALQSSTRNRVQEIFDSVETNPIMLALKHAMGIVNGSGNYILNQDAAIEEQLKSQDSQMADLKVLVSALKGELKSAQTAAGAADSSLIPSNSPVATESMKNLTIQYEEKLKAATDKLEDQEKQLARIQKEYATEFDELQKTFEEEISHLETAAAENAATIAQLNVKIAASGKSVEPPKIPPELEFKPYEKPIVLDTDTEFLAADANDDGIISKDEFQLWMADKQRIMAKHNEEKTALISENRLLRKALNPSSEKAFAELRAAQRLIATLEDDIGASNASLDDVKMELEVSKKRIQEQELQSVLIDAKWNRSNQSFAHSQRVLPAQTSQYGGTSGTWPTDLHEAKLDHENVKETNQSESKVEEDAWLAKYEKALAGAPKDNGGNKYANAVNTNSYSFDSHDTLGATYKPYASPAPQPKENFHRCPSDDNPDIFSLSSVTISPSYMANMPQPPAAPYSPPQKHAYLARTFHDYDDTATNGASFSSPKRTASFIAKSKVLPHAVAPPAQVQGKGHHPLHEALLKPPSKSNPIGKGQASVPVHSSHSPVRHHHVDHFAQPTNSSVSRIHENNAQHEWQMKNSFKSEAAGFKYKK